MPSIRKPWSKQRLDKARASLKAAEDALKDKYSELTKKGEADLAMAKEQADALQTTIKNMQAAVAKLEQTSKQQAATIAERAKEAAEKAKEINMLKAQLSAEQDKVLKLTEELEAAKKAAPPQRQPSNRKQITSRCIAGIRFARGG